MSAQLKETESTEVDLIPANALANPVELFTREKLDDVIERIRTAVKIVPDLTTEDGRKAIASTAYKVARSKTAIDAAGKGMVEGWKAQAKVIDGLRKHAWDSLERIQAEVRAPLTEWEAEQKRIEADAIEAARLRREAEEAERIAELARREAEIAAREAKLAAAEQAEADRLARIQAQADQEARDLTIRAEAAEQATRAAADAIAAAERRAQAEADRAEAAELQRQEDVVREREQAITVAAQAQEAQAAAVRQAEARAAAQAACRDRARLAMEQEQREAEEKRAANRVHRGAVNRKAVVALVAEGLSENEARNVITAIASGKIPAVSIAY